MAKAKTTTRTSNNKKAPSPATDGGNHLAEVTKISTRSIDVQELIRNRAYQLFEERGREPGHDFDDWLRAEAEVLQQFRAKTA